MKHAGVSSAAVRGKLQVQVTYMSSALQEEFLQVLDDAQRMTERVAMEPEAVHDMDEEALQLAKKVLLAMVAALQVILLIASSLPYPML